MSSPYEKAPGAGPEALNYPAGWLDNTDSTRKPTQIDRVREALLDGWTCATWFLNQYLPRYGARIWDLRRAGYYIDRRVCQSHDWHQTTQYEWRITATPVVVEGDPCAACGSRLSHTSTCPTRRLAPEGQLFGESP